MAATKSYIASLAALAHLVAAWTRAMPCCSKRSARAPAALERAWALGWEAAAGRLREASHLFVIARGMGLAVAQEAALKCKETCGLHAESFSSAEVRHGPQALLQGGFPALVLAQDDETRPGIEAFARDLVARGVEVLAAGLDPGRRRCPPSRRIRRSSRCCSRKASTGSPTRSPSRAGSTRTARPTCAR